MADSQRLPSQEELLVDYVHRLEKLKKGRSVLHVHLSALRPFNRREQHLRAAASNLEPLVGTDRGQLFSLRNGDLFFIYKNSIKPEVETAVQKIKFMFSDDPLIADVNEHGSPFSTNYDAEDEYDRILQQVRGLAKAEKRREDHAKNRMDARAALKAKQEKGEPLTPDVLQRIEDALIRADLSNFVRRQFVCKVDENMIPEQGFSELFISIQDLRETMLPNVNLLSNRWLFQHLTETLDRRMLSMLAKTDRITISGEISFNINVSTLLAQDFLTFDDNITASRRGAMVIELQKEDIFSNLASYLFAREFVQAKGYRVLLDGLTVQTMDIIDMRRLGADLAKIVWHPDMVDGGESVQVKLKNFVARCGEDNVVLIRCDTREGIDFGHSIGIRHFQGRYIESLIAEDGRRRDLMKLKRRIERNEATDDGATEV